MHDDQAALSVYYPVLFTDFFLKHKTWSRQREFLTAVKKYPRVAVNACHASSKTFSAAELLLWWLREHDSDTIVLTTSLTGRQVNALSSDEVRTERVLAFGVDAYESFA